DGVRLEDQIEARTIAGLGIVRVVALGQVPEHALDRFRIGVRTDLQHFVIVDKTHAAPCRVTHQPSPDDVIAYNRRYAKAASWRVGAERRGAMRASPERGSRGRALARRW